MTETFFYLNGECKYYIPIKPFPLHYHRYFLSGIFWTNTNLPNNNLISLAPTPTTYTKVLSYG